MANELEDWQNDLIVEEAAARDRIIGLLTFLGTPNFYRTPNKEAELILDQINELVDYDAVLVKRIRTFK